MGGAVNHDPAPREIDRRPSTDSISRWVYSGVLQVDGVVLMADVAAILKAYGKTQHDLSKLTGSRSRASEYVGGQRLPTREVLLAMRLQWGIPFDVLFGVPAGTPRRRPVVHD